MASSMRRVTPRAMSVLSASVADTSIERTDGRAARAPTVRAPPTAPTPSDAMRNPNPSAPSPSTFLARSGTYTLKLKTQRLTTKTRPMASRSRGVPAAYRTPSAISSKIDARAGPAGKPRAFIRKSVTMTPMKPRLLTKNVGATPRRAITIPATAGPTREVEPRGVERDRARHVGAAHQLHHERLARGLVHDVGEDEGQGQHGHVPAIHVARRHQQGEQ